MVQVAGVVVRDSLVFLDLGFGWTGVGMGILRWGFFDFLCEDSAIVVGYCVESPALVDQLFEFESEFG